MPTRPRQLPLGLLDVEIAGADDHIDGGDRLGAVGERGDRLGAAHAVHLATPTARTRQRDRIDRRRRTTTTSATPAARAVTTPITTVLGYGARPPGTYTAARDTGHLAQQHALALGERHLAIVVGGRPRDLGDVRDRDLEARPAQPGRAPPARGQLLGLTRSGGGGSSSNSAV
jgi:hypothetical protein